ncbi:hypothetical protein CLU79DRAFT_518106 [Phycomyces nitens]|nr:hypothetical protein CLU79DRAFT_518106 [Phycomyces nitens]
MDISQPGPSNTKKVRKPRSPPRRLPVHIQSKDVWGKLKSIDSGLSVADWIALDRTAAKDLKDGLRYLGRRKTTSTPMIHMVTRNEDTEETDVEHSIVTDSSESTEYLSDQGTLGNFSISRPFRAPIAINDTVVSAIFDSGASVSVISKSLARRLGLVPSGDRLPLSSLDGALKEPCEITLNVPIRVAGN